MIILFTRGATKVGSALVTMLSEDTKHQIVVLDTNSIGSENKYSDIPFDKTDLWSLSSPKTYKRHMENFLDKK